MSHGRDFASGSDREEEDPVPDPNFDYVATTFLPGTKGKELVMAARFAAGYPIFHPDDPLRDLSCGMTSVSEEVTFQATTGRRQKYGGRPRKDLFGRQPARKAVADG